MTLEVFKVLKMTLEVFKVQKAKLEVFKVLKLKLAVFKVSLLGSILEPKTDVFNPQTLHLKVEIQNVRDVDVW